MAQFFRITQDPAVMSGRAFVRDSQVTVSTLLALLAVGRTQEEILRMFPMLSSEDLREALAYAAWFIDEKTAPPPPAVPSEPLPATPVPQPIPAPTPTPSPAPEPAPAPAVAPEPLPDPAPVPEPVAAPAQSLPKPPADFVPAIERAEPFAPEAPQMDSEDALPTEENLESDDMEEDALEPITNDDEDLEEALELFHPDFPDQATVVITRHGIYDRRWATHTIAWSDIREIHRKRSKKTVEIILRNPEFYVTSMPFFKRLRAQIRLLLNMQALQLDTASLGIRTKDLYLAAHRLWVSHRGRVRFRKKRRMRVNGESHSRRPVEWDRYQPR